MSLPTFTLLRDAIEAEFATGRPQAHASALMGLDRYKRGKGDLATRLRWDVFWAVQAGLTDEQRDAIWHENLTDAQIDSALRRMIKRG